MTLRDHYNSHPENCMVSFRRFRRAWADFGELIMDWDGREILAYARELEMQDKLTQKYKELNR